jgi:plastocyanin domain-containing protein
MNPMDATEPALRTISQPAGMKALVSLAGLGLIALELWWFLAPHGEREEQAAATATENGVQTVHITVDGGYSPSTVRLRPDLPVRILFHRTDPSGCVARVIFPDQQRSLDLPLDEETTLELPPLEPGRYPFHCGMNMVRGELEVVAD